MLRGLVLAQNGLSFFLRNLLIVSITAGLFGCDLSLQQATPTSTVCMPTSSDSNIYRAERSTMAAAIYNNAIPPIPPTFIPLPPTTPTPEEQAAWDQQLLRARHAALKYLVYETERWSDIETIELDNSEETQIAVTFLSPDLIQAIFLSEVLEHRMLQNYDFEGETQKVFNSIAERNELIFLVTVTTNNSGFIINIPHTIDIPIKQMQMMNAEDIPIPPKHDDHNLDQSISSSSEPVFGSLAYPLALLSGNECKLTLEKKYNTNIVITIPFIKKDGIENGPYTWAIPYHSIVNANVPMITPDFNMPPDFNQGNLQPLPLLPTPISDLSNASVATQEEYWTSLARFIWHQVTLGNY